ncbi:MAG TPA: hypothetical protein VGG64_08785 [Pirellulales bacterium]|jgi:hypothetical protein
MGILRKAADAAPRHVIKQIQKLTVGPRPEHGPPALMLSVHLTELERWDFDIESAEQCDKIVRNILRVKRRIWGRARAASLRVADGTQGGPPK